MLRRLMWSGLYVAFAATASLVARLLATRLWEKLTGEPPPARKA